jgi:hypothetical protein
MMQQGRPVTTRLATPGPPKAKVSDLIRLADRRLEKLRAYEGDLSIHAKALRIESRRQVEIMADALSGGELSRARMAAQQALRDHGLGSRQHRQALEHLRSIETSVLADEDSRDVITGARAAHRTLSESAELQRDEMVRQLIGDVSEIRALLEAVGDPNLKIDLPEEFNPRALEAVKTTEWLSLMNQVVGPIREAVEVEQIEEYKNELARKRAREASAAPEI